MLTRSSIPSICLVLTALSCGSSGQEADGGRGGGGGAGGSETHFGFEDPSAGAASGWSGGELDEEAVQALRGAACAGESAGTEAEPAVIQLIVDVSGSMDQNAPSSNRSRWEITRDALAHAVDNLPGTTGLGVLYYPNMGTTRSQPTGTDSDPERSVEACVNTDALIPVNLLGPPGSSHRQALATSLDDASPAGGTPTYDAFEVARGALSQTTLPGNRFLLLITDGQPTFSSGCRGTGRIVDAVDPRPIIDLAQEASQSGVRTFVIGAPGSEDVGVPVFADARSWLSRTASVGGTGTAGCSDDGPEFCHLDMTQEADFAEALRRGLETIVGQVLSCSYRVPADPAGKEIDPENVNIILTRGDGSLALIPKAASEDCSTGWHYSSDGAYIELCTSTCDSVLADSNPQLDVLFGCQSRTGDIR
jgi:hypothetical protein